MSLLAGARSLEILLAVFTKARKLVISDNTC